MKKDYSCRKGKCVKLCTMATKMVKSEPFGDPFTLLPDELLLKIVEMSSKKEKSGFCESCKMPKNGIFELPNSGRYCEFDHGFIVGVISEVSLRFNRIARDEKLWRDSCSKKLYIRHGKTTIHSLPKYLVMKILQMSAWDERLGHGNGFCDLGRLSELGKVSRRFRDLCTSPDMVDNEFVSVSFSDEVNSFFGPLSCMRNVLLSVNKSKLEDVVDNYLGENTKVLFLDKRGDFLPRVNSQDDLPYELNNAIIWAIAVKCQKMEFFSIRFGILKAFPSLPPWTSLRNLTIVGELAWDTFTNVELHNSLPHLENIKIINFCTQEEPRTSILIPDFRGLKSLFSLFLESHKTKFRFQVDIKNYVPIPSNIDVLYIFESTFENHEDVVELLKRHVGGRLIPRGPCLFNDYS